MFLALVGALAACAAGPEIPTAALAQAEADLERNKPEKALELLESVDEDDFAEEDLERYLVRKATALARSRELWDAFETIRDFGQEHAFSRYDGEVQNLEFQIGAQLIQSSGGFLFFTSDADDGQIVLEHFIVHYPEHPATPDALRLLGEKAYSEGDYLLARERFRDLALEHENSEWLQLARFRIAMAWYHSLVGPRYDLHSMLRTNNELSSFLKAPVENPQFREQATAALTKVREWLGRKHIYIADFYGEIGNQLGLQRHLREAAQRYPNTVAGKEASARLGPEPKPTEDSK